MLVELFCKLQSYVGITFQLVVVKPQTTQLVEFPQRGGDGA